jgi:hypothetical protein
LENLLLARKKAEDNLQELTKAHENLQATYNQLNE